MIWTFRFLGITAAAFLFTIGVSPTAHAVTLEDLEKCAQIEQANQRLSCYDEAVGKKVKAKKTTNYVRVNYDLPSHWIVSTEDSRSGGKNVYMKLPSKDLWILSESRGDAEHLKDLRPTLWVQCVEGRTFAYIDWGMILNAGEMEVRLKLDGEEMMKKVLQVDKSQQRIGQWKSDAVVPGIKNMFGKKKFAASLTPKGEKPLVVVFDVSGLEEAVKPLRQACGW